MGVLYALESIRTPALDKIMSVITLLGGELFFMVIAVTVFWCVSKREGYYLMIVGFFGTVINQFLKILCCVPRPWIKNPDFTIVESARAEATGYSFPSGHTQNAVATYGGIARYTRRGWLRVVLVVLTVLIAFSRMYLGVHTPLDVGVSVLIAAALVLRVYPLMEESDRRPVVRTYTLLAMVVCSGAFSPERMASRQPKPTTSLMSCAHHTACVSNRKSVRSAMLDTSMPTVAPSSFQPFSKALR